MAKKKKTTGAEHAEEKEGERRKARVRDLSTRKGDLAGGGIRLRRAFGEFGSIVKKTV